MAGRMWLVRHPDQTFTRPLPESILIEKIEGGEFSRQDEVCASTGYWFALGDAAEVRKFLGNVRLESLGGRNREFSTEIHTDVGITQPGLADEGAQEADFEAGASGNTAAQDRKAGNPVYMALMMVIFLYTLFLIWKNAH